MELYYAEKDVYSELILYTINPFFSCPSTFHHSDHTFSSQLATMRVCSGVGIRGWPEIIEINKSTFVLQLRLTWVRNILPFTIVRQATRILSRRNSSESSSIKLNGDIPYPWGYGNDPKLDKSMTRLTCLEGQTSLKLLRGGARPMPANFQWMWEAKGSNTSSSISSLHAIMSNLRLW